MVYKKLARKKLIYLILAIVLITVALSCGSQILFANTGSSPSKTDLGTVAGNSKVLSLNQAAETVSKGRLWATGRSWLRYSIRIFRQLIISRQ